MQIGVTERGDAALDWVDWLPWVSEGHPAILISKDPSGLATAIQRADKPNVIAHATITGYGSTPLEPHVKCVEDAIIGLKALVELLGVERVVLRIDPVIPTPAGVDVALSVLRRAQEVARTRVRISFIDQYPHVVARMHANGVSSGMTWHTFHAPFEARRDAWEKLDRPEVCGEPGFVSQGCVSSTECRVLGVAPVVLKAQQRASCNCLAMKAELLHRRGPCSHGCLYCYWRGEP